MGRRVSVRGHSRKAHNVRPHYRAAPKKKGEGDGWWEWVTPTSAVLRKGKKPKNKK